ncbi:MFS transporter [Budviciaceae bacterium CWB-B4]|uniref:MFS transporter n=1 Tax=Limnobaculum xujianqingii TaxID=2738837 RepID=A0A9D7AHG5_9GAMM|nr:glycoside-pentoside-hexuronide (GPH):cation symporter [Limnobaculum xujianqingii]MBK5072892.1 MFS transporter [Limnobaculum xujianqingii]MBK5176201.1 MFS transporter [Limnobaculum xujianqingii]
MKEADSVNSTSYVMLGVKEKIAYGFGDLASNLSFGFVSLFLLYFYTDIYGITAAQASLIFVVARVIDAGFNILIGYLVDKTNTRFGKLRPYLLFGSIPLGFLTVLCFTAVESDMKFYYALITYTVYCMAYTAVNTPYSAMTNMMTQHEGSRASLSVYRFVFAMVGYLIVSTNAEYLISLFTVPREGYIFAASCFALLATFFFLACFGMTKERVVIEKDVTLPTLREMGRAIYCNTPLLNLSMFTVVVYIAYTLWMAIAIYFIKYILRDESFTASFFAIQTVAYIVGTILCEKLVALMGKKQLTLAAMLFGAIALIIQYFFVQGSLALTMACIFVYSMGMGIAFVTMWSMVADTVEFAEWKIETRAEGAIYGFFNFVTKIAMAIGGGLAGLLLDYSDYSAANITESALNGINIMMTLVPAAMFVLGFMFILFYRLDEKTYVNIVKQIELRKQNAL